MVCSSAMCCSEAVMPQSLRHCRRRQLAEVFAQHLVTRVARKAIYEDHRRRLLITGEMLPAEIDYDRIGQLGTGLHHKDRDNCLTPTRVGGAHHGAVSD